MTHEQQIKYDLAIYGQAFEMKDVTGKIVRIDPRMIRTIHLGNDNSLSDFINANYPQNIGEGDNRQVLIDLVAKRFNMPKGIADQLISHYTT